MFRFRSGLAASAFVATIFAIAACSDGDPTDPLAPDAILASAASTSGATLLECPVNETTSTTGTIDLTGGTIQLNGHRLEVPLLGVLSLTTFELAAPASNYMELRVRANDLESFSFNKAATIVIDYSRCERNNIEKYDLTVWQIHPVTKELIEHMGGVDDKVARTVTFQTDHLSTFSIAH